MKKNMNRMNIVCLGVLSLIHICGVCGLLLKWLLPATRTTDNRLILALGVLFAFCGLCDMLEVSPLLGCMSMGMRCV